MKIKINKAHKSIPQGLEFQLPKFTVLTGKNGSGKSHLLEAISNTGISEVSDDLKTLKDISYIAFGTLSPQIHERADPQQISAEMKGWWQQIEAIQNQARNYMRQHNWSYETAIENTINQNAAVKRIVEKLCQETNKDFFEITERDVIKNIKIGETNNNGIFFSQFASIFKSYQLRLQNNEFNRFLNETKGHRKEYLSDEEFEAKFGPKPWDLVNTILDGAGLPYTTTNPEDSEPDETFVLKLLDKTNNTEISVNDLSTGERVLMSLALAVYNTKDGGSKPDLIMLDEPDAPLHPQFSKILITTIHDTIVKSANTNVIITTHSPSTVAMCPDNSLYQIDKETKIPTMISIAEGLEILTSDIPHLRVSTESRLQVFVESKYDTAYYERLHNLLSRRHKYDYDLVFLEPHSGTSNCTDVISITKKLTSLGNDLVRGIVDFDGVNDHQPPLYVLGEKKRYSIENYILDPVFICLGLIRAQKFTFQDFGIDRIYNYVEAADLHNDEAQKMADFVFNKLSIPRGKESNCLLENGFILSYPNEFLNMQGHSYEEQLNSSFPQLNAIKKGQGDSALKLGIMTVIEEHPKFLSADIHDTFSSIN
ncbi:AAA family ATPase [Pseudomonas sp. CR3202]|uniref:AAA family ATPase n=1 Tax=Pseudomonas sp. CR3202 TaxID=3351532 RepID=UPI003BF2BA62